MVFGLVVLIIITALVTNAICRRRAQRFDKDVTEAAREVTAAAHASPPNFRDFDDEENVYGSSGGGGGGGEGSGGGRSYTDTTHHTTRTTSSGADALYNQLPMQSAGYESYGMTKLPVAAGVGAGAGAAAGYGAASMYPGVPVADPRNTTTTNANGNTAGVGAMLQLLLTYFYLHASVASSRPSTRFHLDDGLMDTTTGWSGRDPADDP